jgi:carbamoyltransferase
MKILGISAYYHDSAAAILDNGVLIAAAQEERFTRKKNDASFPVNAIECCLRESGYSLAGLDAVVFYDKPFLKFERLLETYCAFAPKGLRSFVKSMPVWLREKLFLKKHIFDALANIERFEKRKLRLLFSEHHLSHSASSFYTSSFTESAILSIDGVGEWVTTSISYGKDNKITVLKELNFPHSLGLFYSAFTQYCGFKVNSDEYKLMGLAPYGNANAAGFSEKLESIRSVLIDIKPDGSIFLNQDYFRYATGLSMVDEKKWSNLFGINRRFEQDPLTQEYCDLALAVQTITTEVVLKLAAEAKKLTGCSNLCLAGGVALNCVTNGILQKSNLFNQVYVQAAAGDAGGAVGAAYAAHYIFFEQARNFFPAPDCMQGMYLGDSFTDKEIVTFVKKWGAVFDKLESMEEVAEVTASYIDSGKVVGWFQGRMEFGPRALGARSILADARNAEMQNRLNLKIKFREDFRPFAPAVLAEDVQEYFDLETPSPYMLFVHTIKKNRQLPLPEDFGEWSIREKLTFPRSNLPAVTHVDFSARVQTVHQETNKAFWMLLKAFKAHTGVSVIINTSFNVQGEPIVRTPEEAYKCFMNTGMDILVMGNLVFQKDKQNEYALSSHSASAGLSK